MCMFFIYKSKYYNNYINIKIRKINIISCIKEYSNVLL